MNTKTDFITALRATPKGISEFCDWTIPELVPTSAPTEDGGTMCQETLAHNLNTILCSLKGLKPFELFLRIGQHNSVMEAILLSGIEYMQETDADTSFEVVEPVDGETYAPGAMRVIVKASSGKLQSAQMSDAKGLTHLTSDDGLTWYAYVKCEELGEYTLRFKVYSGDPGSEEGLKEHTTDITFTVTEDGEDTAEPSGVDSAAFQMAFDEMAAAYQEVMLSLQGG